MKDRQQKQGGNQGGNQPNRRDNDPSRRSEPDRKNEERTGTEPRRPNESDPKRRGDQGDRGGIQDPQRRGDTGETRRGMQGDELNRPSEPRRPFDETNIGDEDSDDDLRR